MRPFQSALLALPLFRSPPFHAAMAMAETIIVLLLLMLILIIVLILFACRPWRFFFSSSRARLVKVGDIERPLIPDDPDLVQNQSNELERNYVSEGSHLQTEESFWSPRAPGLVCKQRLPSTDAHSTQGATLVLDVVSDTSEDVLVGQTLKHTLVSHHSIEERKRAKKEEPNYGLSVISADRCHRLSPRDIRSAGSSLTLEVISGPSCGLRCSLQSTNTSRLPLTLGRVPPSDMLLKDSEISGKHAKINWNLNTLKWELVDMGSLNGTLLNSLAIQHADSGSRQWSEPVELTNGDIITLGTSSRILVQIAHAENQSPFGVGMASDPMAVRRGGKKLPMEDVCYYQWPLPGVEQFGLFGICDGHGGAGAAKVASKMLPEMVANILSFSEKRQRVLSLCDASDVLRDAFSQTEASMNHQCIIHVDSKYAGPKGDLTPNGVSLVSYIGLLVEGIVDGYSLYLSSSDPVSYLLFSLSPYLLPLDNVINQGGGLEVHRQVQVGPNLCWNAIPATNPAPINSQSHQFERDYEGCTATLLLVWAGGDEEFFAQCANVGDSACVVNIDGKQIKMTEDHRVTSQSERIRLKQTGEPLKDGETRLCGLNLVRMLGDKFLKEQESRFSSEPYISQVVHIDKASKAFVLMASDGLWDVMSIKKAVQLVLQMKERYAADKEILADRIANLVLSEARTLRTKDNTSIIFLDFDPTTRSSCKMDS